MDDVGVDIDSLVDRYLSVDPQGSRPSPLDTVTQPPRPTSPPQRVNYEPLAFPRRNGEVGRGYGNPQWKNSAPAPAPAQESGRHHGNSKHASNARSGASSSDEAQITRNIDLAADDVEDIVDKLLGHRGPDPAGRSTSTSSSSHSTAGGAYVDANHMMMMMPAARETPRVNREEQPSSQPPPQQSMGSLRLDDHLRAAAEAEKASQAGGGNESKEPRSAGRKSSTSGMTPPKSARRAGSSGGGSNYKQQWRLVEEPYAAYDEDPLLRRMKLWQERREAKRVQAIYDALLNEQNECSFKPTRDMETLVFSARSHRPKSARAPPPGRNWGQLARGNSQGGGGTYDDPSMSSPRAESLLAPSTLYEDNKAWGFDNFVSRIGTARQLREEEKQREDEEKLRLADTSTWKPKTTVPQPFQLGRRRNRAAIPSLRNNDTFAALAPVVRREFGNPVSEIEIPTVPVGLFSAKSSAQVIHETKRDARAKSTPSKTRKLRQQQQQSATAVEHFYAELTATCAEADRHDVRPSEAYTTPPRTYDDGEEGDYGDYQYGDEDGNPLHNMQNEEYDEEQYYYEDEWNGDDNSDPDVREL